MQLICYEALFRDCSDFEHKPMSKFDLHATGIVAASTTTTTVAAVVVNVIMFSLWHDWYHLINIKDRSFSVQMTTQF